MSRKATYDSKIRTSECGSRLYNTWRKIRRFDHVIAWEDYPAFYKWAIKEYELGAYLRRKDESKPYGPRNCFWLTHGERKRPDVPDDFERKWNTSVNRIRKCCGLPPLEGTEDGNV